MTDIVPDMAIRLRHFRGFEEVELPLKPLTVLLGPNSAGKSCFGHALVVLQQVDNRGGQDTDLRVKNLVEKKVVDVGDYDDLVHEQHHGDTVDIGFKTSRGWVELGFGGGGVDGKWPVPGLQLSKIVLPDSDFPTQSTGVADTSESAVKAAVIVESSERVESKSSRVPSTLVRKNKIYWGEPGSSESESEKDLLFLGLRVIQVAEKGTRSAQPPPILLDDIVANYLRGITYLKPNRANPDRSYERAPAGIDELGASGEWTASYLNDHQSDEVDVVHPQPVPRNKTQAKRQAQSASNWKHQKQSLLEAVGFWMSCLGLAEQVASKDDGPRVRLDVKRVEDSSVRALTDLGFGLSQILPVLVAGLKLPKNGTLVVEQPEAQLHPRPQAALADFFISLTKSSRRALVETHSEAFFHRLRLRVAMEPELAEHIGVYFIGEPGPDHTCCDPVEVDLTDETELDWPIGFLTEGVEEEIAISAIRTVKRRSGG